MTQFINPLSTKTLRCELRVRETEVEKILWSHLRGRGCGGIKFRRQVGVGPFIADFYAHEHALAIELDGAVHDSADARVYDQERDNYFRDHGINTLRFKNSEVSSNIKGVIQKILSVVPSSSATAERDG